MPGAQIVEAAGIAWRDVPVLFHTGTAMPKRAGEQERYAPTTVRRSRAACMSGFDEVRFPDNIAYGATGGGVAIMVVATEAATRSATSTGPRRAAGGTSQPGSRSRRRSIS
jgi:hypothetical protein